MTGAWTGWIPAIIVNIALAAFYAPLGRYMAHVFTSDKDWAVERAIYKVTGVRSEGKQRWTNYAYSVLAFSAVSVLGLYFLQRIQGRLPLAHGVGPVDPDQAWNTAASFTSNTNWQSYAGETTMSQLTQMAGLGVQNFVSAAVGISVSIALVRGLANRAGDGIIGNFWVDLVRTCVRILVPMAAVGAVILITQGVLQNFNAPITVNTVSGGTQTIPGGAVASQEVIKELGTNGGGYFNANAAHPFENPTMWSNMLEIFLILVIPVSLTRTFGIMVRDHRQGWALLSTMAVLFFASFAVIASQELALTSAQGAGLEGKELRLGILPSAFFGTATTMTSTGAVDSFHSSYSPLGDGMLLLNMMLGEIMPGGVGSGLYGILVIAILTVFIAGLMVGRTPEYLGKRIGVKEITRVCLYILVMPTLVLAGVSISTLLPGTREALSTSGPHAFTELTYAFTSASNNNGSAFAGLNADTWWFNISLGLAMLLGRFIPIVMVLALAGLFAEQRPAAPNSGTLPTHRPQFVGDHRNHHHRQCIDVPSYPRSWTFDGGSVMSNSFSPAQLSQAAPLALKKMDPRSLIKVPVMFLVEVGALFTLVLAIVQPSFFTWSITVWLWLTTFFAVLAEAVAEGRGKAQADALRNSRTEADAFRIAVAGDSSVPSLSAVLSSDATPTQVASELLSPGDVVFVKAGNVIPADGDVLEGAASIDESAVTGESAPVIRESGGDRSAVTGGTRVLSDAITIKITSKPGESFLDRMIGLVEGAERSKTPNEMALGTLLHVLTLIFLVVVLALAPMAAFNGAEQSPVVLVALLVCLIPTTIGALLSAIGIAGMDRLVQHNVLAKSGRAVEAAGDVATLLLDKTGTITIGDRQASEFCPVGTVHENELIEACQLASLADETPEGRSVVTLAESMGHKQIPEKVYANAEFIPFTAQTRMSGIHLFDQKRKIVKGAASEVCQMVEDAGYPVPQETYDIVADISASGGTALVVAEVLDRESEHAPQKMRALGVIHLKDVVKPGLTERRRAQATQRLGQAIVMSDLARGMVHDGDDIPQLLQRLRETFGLRQVDLQRWHPNRKLWTVVETTADGLDTPWEGTKPPSLVPIGEELRLVVAKPDLRPTEYSMIEAHGSRIMAIINRQEIDAMRRATAALEAGNRMGTALLTAVSHDLRTPLAGIKAAISGLMMDDVELDDVSKTLLLETIEHSTERLETVVGNLLDMSRLRSNTVNVHHRPVDVGDVLANVQRELPDVAEHLDVYLPAGVPRIMGDAGLIQRIVSNILLNGRAFAPNSRLLVTARGIDGSAGAHDAVEIRIIDHGPGINDEDAAMLFVPFKRLGDQSSKGLGLGLAVAQGFAEAMDGTLAHEHTPGGGATLILTLPSAHADTPPMMLSDDLHESEETKDIHHG